MKFTVPLFACAMSFVFPACSDSPEEARVKNEQYLDRLAQIVCTYQTKHHELPESFDDALAESGQTLPNRGDYYGQGYDYRTFQDSAFFFRAKNAEVNYINQKKVSHAALRDWVRSHTTNDEWTIWSETNGK